MITGGDEALRTIGCNNNPYNLDAATNWLDWSLDDDEATHAAFTAAVLHLRRDHPALRPRAWIDGAPAGWSFLTDAGTAAGGGYLDDPTRHFLAWRIDGRDIGDPARSIYVGYNGSAGTVIAHLPAPAQGHAWVRVLDTAQGEVAAPGNEPPIAGATYDTVARSIVVALELPVR